MKKYLSTMTVNTPASKIYEKLRQLRGREPRKIHILQSGNQTYSTTEDIVNCIGRAFSQVSSAGNYSPQFQRIKISKERNYIDFSADNDEDYNHPFTQNELERALTGVGNTCPGPDRVHYYMLKYMPEGAHEQLLRVFNQLWEKSYFATQWTEATVIPIPKPKKNHTDPLNYRPIALTSCLCKTLEKMINNRLTEYLEHNNLLANIQCGFRRCRSTVDHLIRLDTSIRKAMADGKYTAAVVFDLEKAYDTTWKYGILMDVWKLGLKGRLLRYISEFLKIRNFNVEINAIKSRSFV